MRQLVQEGWIHHICRNAVAIFLTRGDLFLSWSKGMDTFFKYQIDVIISSALISVYSYINKYIFFIKSNTKIKNRSKKWPKFKYNFIKK